MVGIAHPTNLSLRWDTVSDLRCRSVLPRAGLPFPVEGRWRQGKQQCQTYTDGSMSRLPRTTSSPRLRWYSSLWISRWKVVIVLRFRLSSCTLFDNNLLDIFSSDAMWIDGLTYLI